MTFSLDEIDEHKSSGNVREFGFCQLKPHSLCVGTIKDPNKKHRLHILKCKTCDEVQLKETTFTAMK